jgi:hypothetical protein
LDSGFLFALINISEPNSFLSVSDNELVPDLNDGLVATFSHDLSLALRLEKFKTVLS